jgi:trimeric autotransporter adhesin
LKKNKANLIALAAVVAAMAPMAAQAEIRVGVATAVNPRAVGIPPQREERVLFVGIDMQADERVITGPAGRAHLLFVDGSNLSVGPDSEVVIDKFVYDPQSRTGELALSAARGVFRFVGGRISKSSEVQIRTPAAVVGLRGGVSVHNVRTGGQPEQHSFLFGERMTVTAAGVTKAAYQPGFGIAVTPAADGAPPLPPNDPVKWGPTEMQAAFGQFEATPPGSLADPAKIEPTTQPAAVTVGGSAVAPADLTAAAIDSQASSVSGVNSAAPPAPSAPPFFPPSGVNAIVQEVVTDSGEQAAAAGATPASTPPPVLVGRFVGRQAYDVDVYLETTPNATRRPGFNDGVAPTRSGQRLLVTLPQGNADLPFSGFVEGGFTFVEGPFTMPATLGPLTMGGAILDNGQFFFYEFYDPVPTSPLINSYVGGIFGGIPTARAGFPTSGAMLHGLLSYEDSVALTGDVIFLPTKPALRTLGQVVESPIFSRYSPIQTVTQANASPVRSVHMQASLGIIGGGASQKSFLVGETGNYQVEGTDAGGTVALFGGMVGSYRATGADSPLRIGSNLATAEVGTAATGTGNAIFGPAGDYMVLTQERLALNEERNALVRTPALGVSQSILQERGLVQPFSLNEYAVTAGPPPAAPRTTRSLELGNALQGHFAGVVETNFGGTLIPPETFVGTMDIRTSAENNRLEASFIVQEAVGPNVTSLQFGDIASVEGDRSAFIDDNIFSARQSFSRDTVVEQVIVSRDESRIFMVSSNAVPMAQIDGVPVCECAFMKWGWWGGEVVRDEVIGVGDIRDRVHLATWVAGVVTTGQDLITLANQNVQATYNGHAIGNVINGVNKYVAAGNYTLNWNFNTRSGVAHINNFDRVGSGIAGGININGPAAAGTVFGGQYNNLATVGLLGGNVGNTLGFSGIAAGNFFNSPANLAAGVGGHFTIEGNVGAYKAAGTFAAQR